MATETNSVTGTILAAGALGLVVGAVKGAWDLVTAPYQALAAAGDALGKRVQESLGGGFWGNLASGLIRLGARATGAALTGMFAVTLGIHPVGWGFLGAAAVTGAIVGAASFASAAAESESITWPTGFHKENCLVKPLKKFREWVFGPSKAAAVQPATTPPTPAAPTTPPANSQHPAQTSPRPALAPAQPTPPRTPPPVSAGQPDLLIEANGEPAPSAGRGVIHNLRTMAPTLLGKPTQSAPNLSHILTNSEEKSTQNALAFIQRGPAAITEPAATSSSPLGRQRVTTFASSDGQSKAAWITETTHQDRSVTGLNAKVHLAPGIENNSADLLLIAKNLIDELRSTLRSSKPVLTINNSNKPGMEKAIADYCAMEGIRCKMRQSDGSVKDHPSARSPTELNFLKTQLAQSTAGSQAVDSQRQTPSLH